jgi:hypothetical protein
VFPLSRYKFPLPQIKVATTLQYPTARVCFLRVTASSHGSKDPPLTLLLHISPFILYNASPQQTATASGSGGEYGCGLEFWEEQDP